MNEIESALTLEELLQHCCNPGSPQYEKAWRAFLCQYKKFIYHVITKTSRDFRMARLHRDLQENVNDIFGDVMTILVKDDFKALRSFRALESEKRFRSYLAVICSNTTSARIRKLFGHMAEGDPAELTQYMKVLPADNLWMLYEQLVDDLRTLSRRNRANLERDIHILMLYKWKQMPQQTIRRFPCLRSIGERVIEIVSSRQLLALKDIGKY